MSKIEENREKKRRAILNAAQSNFLSEGYIRASMDSIAGEAKVTKQTVYRYFPSKIELFQATLNQLADSSDESFASQLEKPDNAEALVGFAIAFIHVHLSNEHLMTYRLLIAESGAAPEITSAFFAAGPNDTGLKLSRFFSERLGLDEPETPIRLWTAMLLALRGGVLLGMKSPTDQEIEDHAKAATDFLLGGLSGSVKLR